MRRESGKFGEFVFEFDRICAGPSKQSLCVNCVSLDVIYDFFRYVILVVYILNLLIFDQFLF